MHCTSLQHKRISPHVLRHSAAMELLRAGVVCSVIGLWLGHESMETTQIHLHAHMALKEAALEKGPPIKGPPHRLLHFLHCLGATGLCRVELSNSVTAAPFSPGFLQKDRLFSA